MMVDYLRPSDEELRAKYNPELRARAEEEHEGRQQDFDNFVSKLKVAARSDKQSKAGGCSWGSIVVVVVPADHCPPPRA
jgi:hypothetical protein